jgi:hypothetical protein
MADNKKSFLLYCDLIHTTEKLTDAQAGVLFKHILSYVNDQNPEAKDLLTEVAFEPIKQSLKRDLKKYEGIRERNRANALKRWNATASERIPPNTKNADSDSVSVNDIKNINERKKSFYDSLIKYVNDYPKEMIRDFYEYWVEHGENDKKLRFEKEKSFGIARRLKSWYNRNPDQYNKKNDKLVDFIKSKINKDGRG